MRNTHSMCNASSRNWNASARRVECPRVLRAFGTDRGLRLLRPGHIVGADLLKLIIRVRGEDRRDVHLVGFVGQRLEEDDGRVGKGFGRALQDQMLGALDVDLDDIGNDSTSSTVIDETLTPCPMCDISRLPSSAN